MFRKDGTRYTRAGGLLYILCSDSADDAEYTDMKTGSVGEEMYSCEVGDANREPGDLGRSGSCI